jgi:hypothetical protein
MLHRFVDSIEIKYVFYSLEFLDSLHFAQWISKEVLDVIPEIQTKLNDKFVHKLNESLFLPTSHNFTSFYDLIQENTIIIKKNFSIKYNYSIYELFEKILELDFYKKYKNVLKESKWYALLHPEMYLKWERKRLNSFFGYQDSFLLREKELNFYEEFKVELVVDQNCPENKIYVYQGDDICLINTIPEKYPPDEYGRIRFEFCSKGLEFRDRKLYSVGMEYDEELNDYVIKKEFVPNKYIVGVLTL